MFAGLSLGLSEHFLNLGPIWLYEVVVSGGIRRVAWEKNLACTCKSRGGDS